MRKKSGAKRAKPNYDLVMDEIRGLSQEEKLTLFKKRFNEEHVRFVYRQSMMAKMDLIKTMRGEEKEKEIRDMMFFKIREKETPQEEIVNNLAKKMERKIAQVRRTEPPTKGILIVHSPVVHPRNAKSAEPFERLKGKIVEAHEHIEGAAIVYGTSGPLGDPRFGGFILQSKSLESESPALKALEILEAKGPLLP